MDWSKAKSWLILFLAALNIFLIVMLVSTMTHSSTVDKDTIAKTVQVLNNNAIKVSVAQIPDKIPKLNSVEVANALESEEEFAKTILGNDATKSGASIYISGSKTVSFSQSKFTYENSYPESFNFDITEKNAGSVASAFLNDFKINTDHATHVINKTDNGFSVTFNQKLDKYPLFDSYITINLSTSGVNYAEGNWFFAGSDQDNVKTAASRVKPATSALIDFISNEERIKNNSDEISSVTLGYTTGDADEFRALATAVPVWQIKTSDGHIYYFDAH